MTESAPSHHSYETADASPYKDLYIYYLKGLAKTAEGCFGRHFIGAWLEDGFSFLFFSEPCRAAVERFVSELPDLEFLDEYRMPYVEWQGGVVGPGNFGGFFIAPPWSAPPDALSSRARPILLDPGVVFGNGSHATTLCCLEALNLAFDQYPYASALDLGTGTGLLALAAARLGCPRVLAVDFNLLAVRTARDNIRRNRLEHGVLALRGLAQELVALPAELVIANIHFAVMQELVASEGFMAKKGFILSGLLRSQAADIAAELSKKPIKIIRSWETEGIWHTFFGKMT